MKYFEFKMNTRCLKLIIALLCVNIMACRSRITTNDPSQNESLASSETPTITPPPPQQNNDLTQSDMTAILISQALNVRHFGALGNGTTDDTKAIESAINAAQSEKKQLYFPKGQYNYSKVIRLNSVKIFGDGESTILYALDYTQESIFIYGENSEVRFLKLSGVKSPTRLAAWETTRITLFGAKNFILTDLTIEGSAAAGIQTAAEAQYGIIKNCKISDTLADAIHLTDRAHHIVVENNEIQNAGDDGIAVVSYLKDNGLVHHVTAQNNKIKNNLWGRLMSVVGGSDVIYKNNELNTNLLGAACVYLGQENSFMTYSISNVVIDQNILMNCGGYKMGHGAIMIVNDSTNANSNVQITNNNLILNNQPGIRILSTYNTQFIISNNKMTGANPEFESQSPQIEIIP